MNFNLSGLSESLKSTYQQFCKNAEGSREHSREVLMKLHQFDVRQQELGLQTQAQKLNLSQYERMLMQQNPLLWAHLQRSLATNSSDSGEDLIPPIPYPVPLSRPMKQTREMAINTTDSSSNSQHSLHEDGVWPHSPSPYPPEAPAESQLPNNLTIPIQKTAHSSTSNNQTLTIHSNISPASYVQNQPQKYVPAPLTFDQQEPAISSHHFSTSSTQEVHFNPIDIGQFSPASSSTPNVALRRQSSQSPTPLSAHHLQPVQLQFTAPEPVVSQPTNRSQSLTPPAENLQDTLSLTSPPPPPPPAVVPEHHQDRAAVEKSGPKEDTITPARDISVAAEASKSPPQSAKAEAKPMELKPFRLDSESEGADDVLSGPISGQGAGDDDSDSFWN